MAGAGAADAAPAFSTLPLPHDGAGQEIALKRTIIQPACSAHALGQPLAVMLM